MWSQNLRFAQQDEDGRFWTYEVTGPCWRAVFPSTECVPQTSAVPQLPTTFWGCRCSWPINRSRCPHDIRRYTPIMWVELDAGTWHDP